MDETAPCSCRGSYASLFYLAVEEVKIQPCPSKPDNRFHSQRARCRRDPSLRLVKTASLGMTILFWCCMRCRAALGRTHWGGCPHMSYTRSLDCARDDNGAAVPTGATQGPSTARERSLALRSG